MKNKNKTLVFLIILVLVVGSFLFLDANLYQGIMRIKDYDKSKTPIKIVISPEKPTGKNVLPEGLSSKDIYDLFRDIEDDKDEKEPTTESSTSSSDEESDTEASTSSSDSDADLPPSPVMDIPDETTPEFGVSSDILEQAMNECPDGLTEIDISNIEEVSRIDVDMNRCSYLRSTNDLLYFFRYIEENNKLLMFAVREFGNKHYLLEYILENPGLTNGPTVSLEGEEPTLSLARYHVYPANIYETESFIVRDVTTDSFTVEVNYDCRISLLCGAKNEDYDYLNYGLFQYIVEHDYVLPDLRETFYETLFLNNVASYLFLVQNLGIVAPIDKTIELSYLEESVPSISYSGGYVITNSSTTPLNEELLNNLIGSGVGQSHEYVHVFFYGTPVKRSWFEEGLANYMNSLHLHGEPSAGFVCGENGWQEGYHNSSGEFVANSEFISYSDFSINPSYSADFYDPLNPSSYYASAKCFWIYIRDNFGEDGIKAIANRWHNTRGEIPYEEKWFIRDIVNPALGVDLSDLVEDRYSYLEA